MPSPLIPANFDSIKSEKSYSYKVSAELRHNKEDVVRT